MLSIRLSCRLRRRSLPGTTLDGDHGASHFSVTFSGVRRHDGLRCRGRGPGWYRGDRMDLASVAGADRHGGNGQPQQGFQRNLRLGQAHTNRATLVPLDEAEIPRESSRTRQTCHRGGSRHQPLPRTNRSHWRYGATFAAMARNSARVSGSSRNAAQAWRGIGLPPPAPSEP